MELKELINSIHSELEYPLLGLQRKRYLLEYLEELLLYQNNHPKETKVPTNFELFCDLNPYALECRIYDD